MERSCLAKRFGNKWTNAVVYKLRFDSLVPDDLVNALDYYEAISPTLVNRFRNHVNRRFDDLAKRPESFPQDVPPIRFTKIDRFPYLIFFTIKGKNVLVLGIVHGSSEPSKWRDRL